MLKKIFIVLFLNFIFTIKLTALNKQPKKVCFDKQAKEKEKKVKKIITIINDTDIEQKYRICVMLYGGVLKEGSIKRKCTIQLDISDIYGQFFNGKPINLEFQIASPIFRFGAYSISDKTNKFTIYPVVKYDIEGSI